MAKQTQNNLPHWTSAAATVVMAVATIGLGFLTYNLVTATKELASATRQLAELDEQRETAEQARAVALALGRLETVMDSHPGTRTCMRYVIAASLVNQIMEDEPISQWPEDSSNANKKSNRYILRRTCLGGLYSQMSILGNNVDKIPIEAQRTYMREQILSFLNVLDWASTLSTQSSPDDFTEEQDVNATTPDKDGQRNLRRQIRGAVDRDTLTFIKAYIAHENALTKTPKSMKEIWEACRVVDCASKP